MSHDQIVRAFESVLDEAIASAQLGDSPAHGQSHWLAVGRSSQMMLERDTHQGKADPLVMLGFAILHDSRRWNEYHDPQHGPRAAAFAQHLYEEGRLPLSEQQAQLLIHACDLHGDDANGIDPTVAACYDSDRLQLPRVGIDPWLDWYSRPARSDADLMEDASRLHQWESPARSDWSALINNMVRLSFEHDRPAISNLDRAAAPQLPENSPGVER